jgi:hypothetical protein
MTMMSVFPSAAIEQNDLRDSHQRFVFDDRRDEGVSPDILVLIIWIIWII